MTKTARKLPTYDDILKLPPNVRGEIIFDELITSPRPSPAHQRIMAKVTIGLGGKYEEGGHGEDSGGPGKWIFLTEPELHCDSHILVPDVAAWRAERVSPEFYTKSWISLRPDWVCEILSPSTAGIDRVKKRRIYLALGIPYYWIIDPIAKTLEAMKSRSGEWIEVGSFSAEEKVAIEPFHDFEFDLTLFWAPESGQS